MAAAAGGRRGSLLFGPAYGRACDRAAGIRFASWRVCTGSGNTPEECTPGGTLRRIHPPPDALTARSDLRDHPPLAGPSPLGPPPSVPTLRAAESGTRRGTRGISANSMLTRCLEGRGMRGRIALRERSAVKRLDGCMRGNPCKTDRPSVENDRLADAFLINTSSVQHDS